MISFAILTIGQADDNAGALTNTPCVIALKRFPAPDATWTAKHLWTTCPELCRNSSGHFATGQFPHPWDCNAFINCYNDDAWVHWCQVNLVFNENNLQCDYPRNVNCQRSRPSEFTVPVDVSTQSQWEFLPTTPAPRAAEKIQPAVDVITCKDSQIKLNEKEALGPRPDLCTDGTGNYRAPDCRFYVKCAGVQAYVARCPADFVFDAAGRQCDWPRKNPACLKSCQDSGNYDNNDTPQKPVDLPKPIDLDVRTQNLSCNESHCVPKAGCQAALCRQPKGQFAIAGKCTSFANCWDNCAYISTCPAGMVFSETRGMCDNALSLPSTDPCYQSANVGTQLQGQTSNNNNNNNNNSNHGEDQDQEQTAFGGMKQSQSMNSGRMAQSQSL
ncbi:hypothetical protein BV898_04785 [Hypsibius exemplaris]|uniref:Chitin-binding type-2 domain-containing protein n=1 Tax=Hypsibius exemplaris TaxID=2072580 RepID=A0A1W0X1L6_HYPEX|nr:hypothetical protein BV898_04785 [Hypsibius exemplaris]